MVFVMVSMVSSSENWVRDGRPMHVVLMMIVLVLGLTLEHLLNIM